MSHKSGSICSYDNEICNCSWLIISDNVKESQFEFILTLCLLFVRRISHVQSEASNPMWCLIMFTPTTTCSNQLDTLQSIPLHGKTKLYDRIRMYPHNLSVKRPNCCKLWKGQNIFVHSPWTGWLYCQEEGRRRRFESRSERPWQYALWFRAA